VSYATLEGLHECVQAWIVNQGWTDLTMIQARAIPAILDGHGALLVAPTAGGKTEAALLPIISTILSDASPPVSLLYIAPLRALINDQAERAERMLRETSLRCAWWHGDLSHAKRLAIARDLPDALLTTPESLEVHLSSPAYRQGALLGNVRFVLIDEIHAFAGEDRGAQLISLLNRLEVGMQRPLTRVGLSATIGNPSVVAQWLRSPRFNAPPIDVLAEPGNKQRALYAGLIAVKPSPGESKTDYQKRVRSRMHDVVAKHVVGRRSIVFVKSRAEAEELTVHLRPLGIEALIHHGSLSVEMRRTAEEAMKRDEPKVIVATSTLELGIDIGDLEQVIQIGPLGSVSSWLQRVGRSGRSKDATSVGLMYALDPADLPQVLALCDLALESVSEPIEPSAANMGVAFHQVLNLVRERDLMRRDDIVSTLRTAACFAEISDEDWRILLDEMLADDFLEAAGDRVQVGAVTEQQFGFSNYRSFYSVFEAETGWLVKHGTTLIGSLAADFPLPTNREVKFVLGGSWWRVVTVDAKSMVVVVEAVGGGKAPNWRSDGGETSFEVMQRTAAILAGVPSRTMGEGLRPHVQALQQKAAEERIAPRRIVVGEAPSGVELVTYCGERINRYLGSLIAAEFATPALQPTLLVKAARVRITSVGATSGVVAEFLVRLLGDAVLRQEIETRAFEVVETPTFGKYGKYLGPSSRRRAWAARFLAVPHRGELMSFEVVLRSVRTTFPAR